MTEPAEKPRPRRRHLSVRIRVLAAVLAMSLLGLAATGWLTNAVQTRSVQERIDAALSQEVEEFRTLATKGIDPDTGAAFTSVDQLLLVALQRNVPSENEMFLTFQEGQPVRYSAGGLRELAESDALRDTVGAVPPASPNVVTTELKDPIVGKVRLSVVPVSVQGSSVAGKYIIAHAVDRELDPQNDLMRTFTLVALGALVLIGIVGWVVVGRLLRPLHRLRNATQQISESDLSERVDVDGYDDVSEVARAFNEMLDRLEAAFAAQRQFLDDAGHELKTPITIVRGHLELLDPHDPRDVEETRVLLLDEVDRMSRLTQDLILLAKAERADFVQPEPLELGLFTDEVIDKARALGDRTWRVDRRAEGAVLGDPQRLTQAVLQLADNAVKFSQPGTTIAVGTRIEAGVARISVRDEGQGIPPGEEDRIFDRFARTAGARRVEGSGLGLAIVRAIAEAHHGSVEVARDLPVGAVITIVVPVGLAEHGVEPDTDIVLPGEAREEQEEGQVTR